MRCFVVLFLMALLATDTGGRLWRMRERGKQREKTDGVNRTKRASKTKTIQFKQTKEIYIYIYIYCFDIVFTMFWWQLKYFCKCRSYVCCGVWFLVVLCLDMFIIPVHVVLGDIPKTPFQCFHQSKTIKHKTQERRFARSPFVFFGDFRVIFWGFVFVLLFSMSLFLFKFIVLWAIVFRVIVFLEQFCLFFGCAVLFSPWSVST